MLGDPNYRRLSPHWQRQWKYWCLAVGFFTRLPVPSFADFKESDLNHAARYFPLVGWLVGIIAVLVWWLATLLLPADLAILCSMAATIYLTGAFHEDGLADSADGIGGGLDKDKILVIMQDSRLGSYGAVALIGMLFFKFHALLALSPALLPFALIAAHALSRGCAVGIMATARYVRFQGKAKPLATVMRKSELALAALFGLLPVMAYALMLAYNGHAAGCMLLCVSLPVSLIWFWWRQLILRNLQGYTGDTLGATQQLTELAFYLGLVMWERLA